MLRRPDRKLISLAVIAFWLVMMSLYLARENRLPFISTASQSLPPRMIRPSDSWMGVFMGNARIGFVNTNTTPDSRNGHFGVAYTVTAKLKLRLLTAPLEVFISGTAWIPQDDSKAEFDFKVRSADHAMRVAAALVDGSLTGQIHTAGERIPFQFPVGKNLLVSGAMGTTSFNLPVLQPGQDLYVDTLDPMTFSVGKAHIECLAEETIEVAGQQVKTKVVATTLNGLASKAWVTDEDEIVRAETPFGFSLRKITPQEALAPTDGSDTTNVLRSVSIEPTGKKPHRGAKRMVVRLAGVSGDRMPPVDETQTAEGNVYTITVPPEPAPGQAIGTPPEGSLEGDAFIQIHHPRIAETATHAVEGEKDPWQRAMRIYTWVFSHIRKTSVFSIPSALEVLDTREGDCNEHTVLFTALARAAGIPTRIAIGLVWSDQLAGFYYHAWPEVYIGRWIWMEPTLGQPIADATHLKLVNGNIENWPQLLPYLGQLQIEVITIE